MRGFLGMVAVVALTSSAATAFGEQAAAQAAPRTAQSSTTASVHRPPKAGKKAGKKHHKRTLTAAQQAFKAQAKAEHQTLRAQVKSGAIDKAGAKQAFKAWRQAHKPQA